MTHNVPLNIIIAVLFLIWLGLTVAMMRVCVIPLFWLRHKKPDKETPELNKFLKMEME